MKKVLVLAGCMVFLLGCAQLGQSFYPQKETFETEGVEVYFCLKDPCSEILIQKINSAEESIYIAIYSFTLDSVAASLVRAKQRGVEIKVIFDESQLNEFSEEETLLGAGIPIRKKASPPLMHHKFCVIDRKLVGTGSFNYSLNAISKNDENLVFFYSEEAAEEFIEEFEHVWEAAR